MISFYKATFLGNFLGQGHNRTTWSPEDRGPNTSHTSELTVHIYTYTADYLRGTTLMGSYSQNVGLKKKWWEFLSDFHFKLLDMLAILWFCSSFVRAACTVTLSFSNSLSLQLWDISQFSSLPYMGADETHELHLILHQSSYLFLQQSTRCSLPKSIICMTKMETFMVNFSVDHPVFI